MADYRAISAGDRKLIVKLEKQLGSKTLRTLLAPEDRTRLVSNRRLGNLSSGKGMLTNEESSQLARINQNAANLMRLQTKGAKAGKRDYRVNRALRSWVRNGRSKGESRDATGTGKPIPDDLKAIRALRYLGVDVDSGKYYVKRK